MKDHDKTYTSLSRVTQSGRGPDDDKKVCHMRRAAFEQQRVAVIHLDKCNDDWTRQVVINECKRQLGVG
jgi:hypothetical protein